MRVERGRRYELRHNTNATALICAAGLLFPAYLYSFYYTVYETLTAYQWPNPVVSSGKPTQQKVWELDKSVEIV